jgi:hypothetical protein
VAPRDDEERDLWRVAIVVAVVMVSVSIVVALTALVLSVGT